MKTEQQNIAIAESLGWSHVRIDHQLACGLSNHAPHDLVGLAPINSKLTHVDSNLWVLPDYTGDLNAIHDVLSSIPRSQLYMVNYELTDILRRDTDNPYGNYTMLAKAEQLAEAYLRALGLWVESNE